MTQSPASLAPTLTELDRRAIDWLLQSDEPGIVLQTRRDILGERVDSTTAQVEDGKLVSALFAGQQSDGGFGTHPYQKWMGGHWRLVSLVELGVPADEPRARAALESELDWIAMVGPHDQADGRYRVHASMHGNALAVGARLGLSSDPRVRALAESLVAWQWADGGWNCQREARVDHSSFYESVAPLWGLTEYASATGDGQARAAAARTAEFLLQHRVFRSHRSGAVGDAKWLKLRYPEYWHCDYLHGLLMLARTGALPDPRADDALGLLREQQQRDGRWRPEGPQYWKGSTGPYGDAARWTADSASQMLTINALRVVRAAGI